MAGVRQAGLVAQLGSALEGGTEREFGAALRRLSYLIRLGSPSRPDKERLPLL